MTAIPFLAALAVYLLGEWAARRGGKSDRAVRRLDQYVARREGRRRAERSVLAQVDRRLVRAHLLAVLERRLRESGAPLKVSEALLATGGCVALLGSAAGAVRGMGAALVVAAACPLLAWWGLAAARDRRVRRIDLQLSGALDLLIGQLRAHRSPAEAIVEVVNRVSEPLRGECARVAEEVQLGAPLPQALDGLRRRIPSRPLGTVVTAILVTDRTGGNLAEFLSRQSRTVRDQVAFLQEIRAVTAHARSTAMILTLLPMGVAVAMYLLDPGFFSPMLAPGLGRALLASAVVMELVGWLVIRGMIRSVER